MFKEYVGFKKRKEIYYEIIIFFSDSNHFNNNWFEKIRNDTEDNYRIKVEEEKLFEFILDIYSRRII